MKHTKRISKKTQPMYAQSDSVCGEYTPTGKVKCVDADSPKAEKIETIPVP
ncbi:MAG: hypothetical protein AMXMBFR82_33920 [Candidatus Hydrogenedentota bacterium]